MVTNKDLGELSANQQHHGTDIATDLEKRSIAPDVTDVGAAVNQAVADLSPTGGIIELPRGMVPCDTQFDFSNGVNNQDRATPIIVQGHGRQTDFSATTGGTILDATNLTGSVIFQGGGIRENVALRDFAIYNTDNTANAIHLGAGSNQWIRWEISNIAVRDGGAYGLYSEYGGYDSELSNIYVANAQQAYYLYRPNTIDAHGLTARLCNADDYVVEIEGGFGYDIGPLYCESNDGGALQTWGTHRSGAIGPVYLERNNGGAAMASELRLGDDTLTNTADMRACDIGPIFGSSLANAVSGTRIHLSRVHFCNFRSVGDGGTRMDMLQDTRGDNIWQGCWLGAVDTSTANTGSTWIQNDISDTTNRNSGATVVSGS